MARRLGPAVALAGLALAGCSGSPPAAPGAEPSSQAAPPAPADRFVVFAKPALVIDRLGVPVPAPVTVGSTPGPDTLASDAPEVVSVEASGTLVGHRNGWAAIRATGSGAVLEVEVREASAVALVPAELELGPGASARLALVAAGGGEEIPGEGAQWFSDAPHVALVRDGVVEAGSDPGVASITAVYGSVSARAKLTVGAAPGPAIAVEPARPVLRVGEVVRFRARADAGEVEARWRVSPGGALQRSGPATFVARAPGKAEVCGTARLRTSCTAVTVRR